MTRALTKYALTAGFAGTLAIASTASLAQAPVGPTLPPTGGPYGAYGPGPAYGYYPQTNGIYGGPSSDLFDYEGPNLGEQVQTPPN